MKEKDKDSWYFTKPYHPTKGIKFTKELLVDLYINKKLSLTEIGKIYNCTRSNVYRKMEAYGIRRRKPGMEAG